MKKRTLAVWIFVILAMTLLAGCGGGGGGETPQAASATAGKWDEMVWDTGGWGD